MDKENAAPEEQSTEGEEPLKKKPQRLSLSPSKKKQRFSDSVSADLPKLNRPILPQNTKKAPVGLLRILKNGDWTEKSDIQTTFAEKTF